MALARAVGSLMGEAAELNMMLECRNKTLQHDLELANAVIKAFQGDIEQDRPFQQNNTCPNCIGRRNALTVQREFLRHSADAVMASHEQTEKAIMQCRLEHDKLQIQLNYKDMEINALKAEMKKESWCKDTTSS